MIGDEELLALLLQAFPEFWDGREREALIEDELPAAIGDLSRWIGENLIEVEMDPLPPALRQKIDDLLASVGKARAAPVDTTRLNEELVSFPRNERLAPSDAARVKRFFDLMEEAARDADFDRCALLAIELFEEITWIDQADEYLGPKLRAIRDVGPREASRQ